MTVIIDVELETNSAMEHLRISIASLIENDYIQALREAQTSKTIFDNIRDNLVHAVVNIPDLEYHYIDSIIDLIDDYIAFCKFMSPDAQADAQADAQDVSADNRFFFSDCWGSE